MPSLETIYGTYDLTADLPAVYFPIGTLHFGVV